MLQVLGDTGAVRESKGSCLDFFVCFLDILGLKGRPPVGQGVADDPKTPDIHLAAVSPRLQNFWGDIVGGSADGFPFFPRVLQPGGQPKVAHFDFHVLIEEYIPQLKIAMYNFLSVEVL